MTHDELALDLAAHLRGGSQRVTWCDMQLGPAGSPRPDVYSMEPTYTRLTFEAFEVKVSVSDFRSDVTSGKWQKYLKYANKVTFAVPAGLIDKKDVPATCGLIVRHESGWRYAKKPTSHVLTDIPWQAWIKLLLDGTERSEHVRRLNMFNEWRAQNALAKKFGQEVGALLSDIRALPTKLEHSRISVEAQIRALNNQLDAVRKEAAEARERAREKCSGSLAKLAHALGLADDAAVIDLEARANQLIGLLSSQQGVWRRNQLLEVAGEMEVLAKSMRDLVTNIGQPVDGERCEL